MISLATYIKHMTKRGPGRPPKGPEALYERVNIRLPQSVMRALERVQAKREDEPDISQVIRETLVRGLKAAGEL